MSKSSSPSQKVLEITSILLLSIFSLKVWQYEVIQVRGWAGLAWINGFPYSSIVICFFAALAFWIACGAKTFRKSINFIASAFVINMVYFFLFFFVVILFFSRFSLLLIVMIPLTLLFKKLGLNVPEHQTLLAVCVYTIGSIPIFILNYIYATFIKKLIQSYLGPISNFIKVAIVLGVVAVNLLGFATIKIFPALNGDTDWLHAYKMGYPAFFVPIFAALAVYLSRKRTSNNTL